jgi:membrane-bound lytic murein transglycosylase A
MRLSLAASMAAALALSACSSARMIPASPSSPSRVPAAKPAVASQPAASKPTPATPMVPVAAVSAAGPTARSAGVAAGPAFDTLPVDAAAATRALKAFRLTCPSLIKRTDASGLTRPADWGAACTAAKTWSDVDAISFFATQLEVVQIGDGKAHATGYYEPEILGSRTQAEGYAVPVYKRPPEIVEVDLGQFSEALKGKKVRGKVSGNTFVPFDDRAKIEEGSLAGRGLEIAYAADAVELFFLQVQGSGRLKLPGGGVMRIGYDGQNGRDYTGIGKLMKDRGLLAPGQASMQGIMDWLRANPEEGKAIMRENKSWVFFKELTGAGPLGALGYQVTPRVSVAADPAFIPLGAPVFLSMDRAEANGLWIAQDTGGAIKGSNRVDTFWGAGDEARAIAGGMSARGVAMLLLPKGTLTRIQQEQASVATSPKP